MAQPGKSSERSRPSKALCRLQAALGLEDSDWRAFLKHARNGFADCERGHWGEQYSALQIDDVPESWFQDPEAIGHVTLRVLTQGKAKLAVPVALYFVKLCDLELDSLCFAPGVGLAWLCLARNGMTYPIPPDRLARMALDTPAEFFQGVSEEDRLDLCRLFLEIRGMPEAWDLHLVLAAVDRARLPGRAPFHLFHDLMAADWLPREVKREFCRGLLGCGPEKQRLQAKSAEIRAHFQSASGPVTHIPGLALEVSSIGLRALVPGLQRHAVLALVETVGEPVQEVIAELLLRPERDSRFEDMVHMGALDVIHARAAELGPEEVRKLLGKAIKKGTAIVRQGAYRIGLQQFGAEFVRPALRDPARRVRDWASKALAGKPTKPR